MKRKLAAVLVPVILLAGAVWWSWPRPILPEGVQITAVRLGTEQTDVTEQVDLEALDQTLRTGVLSPIPGRLTSFAVTEDTVTIDSDGSWHIAFSEDGCFAYDSGSRYHYAIKTPAARWAEVLPLMPS